MATPASTTSRPARHDVRPVVTFRVLVTSGLFILAVVACVFLLARVFSTLLIFLVGVVVAEGIRSSVERFRRIGLPLPVAILVVYVILLGVLALMIALLVQPLISEA